MLEGLCEPLKTKTPPMRRGLVLVAGECFGEAPTISKKA